MCREDPGTFPTRTRSSTASLTEVNPMIDDLADMPVGIPCLLEPYFNCRISAFWETPVGRIGLTRSGPAVRAQSGTTGSEVDIGSHHIHPLSLPSSLPSTLVAAICHLLPPSLSSAAIVAAIVANPYCESASPSPSVPH